MVTYTTRNKFNIGFESLILYFLLFLTIVFFCVLPMRSENLRHIIVSAGSALFYLLAIYRMIKFNYKASHLALLLVVFFIILFGILLNEDGFKLELFYASANFLSFLIILTTERDYSLTAFEKRIINCFVFLNSCIVFILANSTIAYIFADGTSNGSLVLGMTNPNLTGMILFALFGIVVIFYKQNKTRFILNVVLFTLFYFILLTDSRTALIGTVLLTIYVVLLGNKHIPKLIIIISVFFPLIIVPVYLFAYNTLPADIMFLDKPLFSGRQMAFQNILEVYNSPSKVLFGDISKYMFANATNAAFTVYLSIGVIGVFIVYYLYLKKIILVNTRAQSNSVRIAILCMLSFFIQSSAESYIFTGAFPGVIYIYIYSLFLLNNGENI